MEGVIFTKRAKITNRKKGSVKFIKDGEIVENIKFGHGVKKYVLL